LSAYNPGGHSSQPRADNAIYELTDALKAVQAFRFPVQWSDTTIGFFKATGAITDGPLGAAMRAFAAGRPNAHYRRRTVNEGFKAGNVMDFLDHHAAGLDYFLCLDADSEMTPAAVLRLVACMEADDRLAILQQLIHGRPATAAFPRLFQFGMRQGMRSWATGQAWWQGDEGPYWGHNAIIRTAPFRGALRPARPAGPSALRRTYSEPRFRRGGADPPRRLRGLYDADAGRLL